jgi:hypothetical protein
MDVSKNTLAVLLVLVIAVSGFTTWSLLSKESTQDTYYYGADPQSAVSLSVVKPAATQATVNLKIDPLEGQSDG